MTKKVTLHEEICAILRNTGNSWTTTKDLAALVNQRGRYHKRDGSLVSAFQIHGRTRKYVDLFERNGAQVRCHPECIDDSNNTELTRVLFELSEERELISLDQVKRDVPGTAGLYAIYIDSAKLLPSPFRKELKSRDGNLLYIGTAKNLQKRLVGQDLTGRTSTFFRGIGTVLGYRPPSGSLRGKQNQNNYRFNTEDRGKIIKWINLHVRVRWCECEPNYLERNLIERIEPLLNTTYNPRPFPPLAKLRKECRNVARN